LALPGSSHNQALLQKILDFYAADKRVRAVILFGSLVRGNWDEYSDIDLDLVIADEVTLDAEAELKQLCAFLGPVALIVPNGSDSGDVVLDSLLEFSIRYHPLSSTSPNIIDSMQVLAGSLDHAAIYAAGAANRKAAPGEPAGLLDECLRYTLEIDNALQRRNHWLALELLHRIRQRLMPVLAPPEVLRSFTFFEQQAGSSLERKLAGLVATVDPGSQEQALSHLLTLLQDTSLIPLTPAQQSILNAILQRRRRPVEQSVS
jgi:predicted nucleotidyltransferase